MRHQRCQRESDSPEDWRNDRRGLPADFCRRKQWFKALLHTLAPKYRIPSRKYFAETVIPNIAQRIRAEVQAKLQEGADYISFTTDVWSSDVNSDLLIGLTAHWVDRNFQRKSAVLQVHSLMTGDGRGFLAQFWLFCAFTTVSGA